MIRTLERILIILLICGLIAAGVYWFFQANPNILGMSDQAPGGRGPQFDEMKTANSTAQLEGDSLTAGAFPPTGNPGERPGHKEDGGDPGQAVLSILKNLFVIALITVTVTGVQSIPKLTRRLKSGFNRPTGLGGASDAA